MVLMEWTLSFKLLVAGYPKEMLVNEGAGEKEVVRG